MTFHKMLTAGYVTVARLTFRDNTGKVYTRTVIIRSVENGEARVRFAASTFHFTVKIHALSEF